MGPGGSRAAQSRLWGGGGGHRAETALTSAGRSIHESAVTPVVEEEVGPVLIVAEDIRGTAAEDGEINLIFSDMDKKVTPSCGKQGDTCLEGLPQP